MKIFVINHTQIFVDLISIGFWMEIADIHLQFRQTKHLQCVQLSSFLPAEPFETEFSILF